MPKSVFSRNSVAKCYTLEVEQSKVQLTYTKMANRFLALTVSHIVRFILQVQKAVFQFQGRLCLLCLALQIILFCTGLTDLSYLPPTTEMQFLSIFVCLSVSKITQKRVHGFG